MNECKTTNLEKGWDLMHKMNLEGLSQTQLSPKDYIMIYTYPSTFQFLLNLCISSCR